MTDQIISGEDYSLKTQILMDFSSAIKEAGAFADQVSDIATAFSNMSRDVKNINLKVADLIKAEITKWNESALFGNKFDIGKTIKEKVERAIATNIAKRDVTITGGAGEPIQFALRDSDVRKINTKVTKAIQEALSKLEIQPFNLPAFQLTDRHTKQIQAEFVNKLSQAINEGINFVWEGDKKKSFSLTVTSENMQAMLDAFKTKFLSLISNPAFFTFADVEPVKIDVSKMTAVLNKIRDSLGDIDKHLNIDFEELRKLPNIDKSLAKFREHIQIVVAEIADINKKISGLSTGVDVGGLQQVGQQIATLRTTIITKIGQLLKEITQQVATIPAGTIEQAKYQAAIGNIGVVLNNYVLAQIDGIMKSLLTAAGAQLVKVQGKDVYVAGMKQLQERLVAATKEALKGIDFSKLGIDVAPLQKMLDDWSDSIAKALQERVVGSVTKLTDAILRLQGSIEINVFNFINDLEKGVEEWFKSHSDYSGMIRGQDIVDYLIPRVQQGILDIITSMVPVFDAGKKIQVTIPSEVIEKIQESIYDVVLQEIKLVQTTPKQGTKSGIQELIKKETEKLAQLLIERARNIFTALIEGVSAGSFMVLSAEEQAQVQAGLQKSAREIINSYLVALQRGLGTLVVSQEVIYHVQSEMQQAVDKAVQKVKFEVGEFTLDINSIIKKVVKIVEDALKKSLATLDVGVPQWNLNINSLIIQPIQQGLRRLFVDLGKEIKEQLAISVKGENMVAPVNFTELLMPVNKVINNYLRDYIKTVVGVIKSTDRMASFQAVTGALHPEVRRALAAEAEMSVRAFQRANPLLQGEEFLQKIMRENINAIFKRFHAVLTKSATQIVKEYQQALGEVEVKPNLEAVWDLTRKMTALQDAIAKKVKELLDAQFKALMTEIKELKLYPASIGAYVPPASVRRSVESTARGMARSVSSGRGAFPVQERVYAAPYSNIFSEGRGRSRYITPGGDTRTFVGSVINTMRYITAGMLMGIPMGLVYSAWESARQFDYDLKKAETNLLAKEENILKLAEERVKLRYEQASRLGDYGITARQYNNEVERRRLVEEEVARIRNLAGRGAVRPLQDIALNFGINQEEMGRVWEITTRRVDNPYEALSLSRSAAKIYAYEREELTPEEAAKGMEAIASQWGLRGQDMDRVANMLIKAGLLSQASVKDLLQAQARSGITFAQNMPGIPKSEALATSLVLQSLFTQTTARTGSEAGTFWRTVFEAPFRANEAKFLEQMAESNPALAMLSPFKKIKQDDGTYRRIQKTGLEMFLDIVEAARKLDDQSRIELLNKVYKTRYTASAEAIQALIEDIDKLTGYPDLRSYIKDVENVTPEEAFQAIAGKMDTYEFQRQRALTMWQISTFGVFESLKPQFSSLITYLTAFLRVIRDNADKVASVLSIVSKIAVGLGIKFFMGKGQSFVDRFNQRQLQKSYATNMGWLEEEAYIQRLKKLSVMDEMAYWERQGREIEIEKTKLATPISKAKRRQDIVKNRLEQAKHIYNEMLAEGADSSQLALQQQRIDKLQKAYDHFTQTLDKYNNIMAELEAKQAGYNRQIEKLTQEMAEVDKEAVDLQKRMVLLDTAFADMGLRGKQVISAYHLLSKEFKTGAMDIERFERALQELARVSGLSEGRLNSLRQDVDALVKEFKEGKMTAEAFSREIRQLERNYRLGDLGAIEGKAVAELKGVNLLDAVIAGSLFGKQMRQPQTAQAMLGEIGGQAGSAYAKYAGILAGIPLLAKMGGFLGNLFGKGKALVTGEGAIAKGIGTLGRVGGKIAGKLSIGGKFLGGPIGWGLAAMEILGNPLASSILSPGERLQEEANQEEQMIKRFQNIRDAGWLPKIVFGAFEAINTLTGGLSRLFGGTTPSFSEYGQAWKALLSGEDDLQTYLTERLGVAQKKGRALALIQEEQERYLRENPTLDLNGDGLREDTSKTDWREVTSFEEGQQMLSLINERLNMKLAELNSEFEIKKSELLRAGFREDSDRLRNLMAGFLRSNIEALEEAVKQIQERKRLLEEANPNTYKDNEAWQALHLAELQHQATIAQQRLQLSQTEFSEVDEITSKLERERQLIQAEYSIKRGKAILGGAQEDSWTVRSIERAQVEQENRKIATAITELQNLMQRYAEGDARREQIWLQIKQLQAESTDNLVKIRKALPSQGTFNLPPEIKPLTYWEAKTLTNNYRNMTYRQGDVIVNLNIDNMSGSPSDVQKISEVVAKTIRDTQAGLTGLLWQQVKSGIGSNYRPLLP
ncbi:hypothetical protein E308F_30060 [Moorella sp. E308F]|uniref:phage tail tape measure protein n=1 Tax=Moorella sp. E308F TaxID=2572682 RepID=UPI0010FFC5EC|nr:phage tail tape measure protein [Moorella sp. E308F]GEA16760.1 hypothetical protein E308F_30060 [Moorella sp. E308F]